jgi:hypothetical protein
MHVADAIFNQACEGYIQVNISFGHCKNNIARVHVVRDPSVGVLFIESSFTYCYKWVLYMLYWEYKCSNLPVHNTLFIIIAERLRIVFTSTINDITSSAKVKMRYLLDKV